MAKKKPVKKSRTSKRPVSKPKRKAKQKPVAKTAKKPGVKKIPKPEAKKVAKKPAVKEKPERVEVTPKVRNLWVRIRQAWSSSFAAFDYALTSLNDDQAELLYEMVKYSALHYNYADIRKEHPELKEVLRNESDRRCMYDAYKYLSWRLNRRVELPPQRKVFSGMRGKIGREAPDFNTNY